MPKISRSYEGPGYRATLEIQTKDTEEHSAFVDQAEYVGFSAGQALRDLADKIERMRVDVMERKRAGEKGQGQS